MGILKNAERAYYGTGRRKNATAKVWVVIPGTGKIKVNGKDAQTYFQSKNQILLVQKPFEITDTLGKFDVIAKVKGGGISAHADAVRLGIARALVEFDVNLKQELSRAGLLTRDPREKERKKYGQPGRRKQYQYHKR